MYIAYAALWLLIISNLLGILFGIYGYIAAKQWERFARGWSEDENNLSLDTYIILVKHTSKRYGIRRMYQLNGPLRDHPTSRLILEGIWNGKRIFEIKLWSHKLGNK